MSEPSVDSGEKPGEARSRGRWGDAIIWGLRRTLLVGTVALGAGLAAKVAVVASRGYWPLLPVVLRGWRTLLLLSLAAVLALIWEAGTPDSPSRPVRRVLSWTLPAAALLALFLLPSASRPSRFGWIPPLPAGKTHWVDRGHPHRPAVQATGNSLGFRDRERALAPAPGTRRVIVVGDSYVFGSGVTQDATISAQLEAELARVDPDGRWEVLNAGCPGWGLLTYLEVARTLLVELRPRAIVISSLGASDWHLLEPNQTLDVLGPIPFRILTPLGVTEDLRDASLIYAEAVTPAASGPVLGQARVDALLRSLLAEADARDADVFVWDWYEPTPSIDRFDPHPRFHRTGWPPDFDRRWDGWGSDPVLAIPVDRHPTAEGHRRAAGHLAPLLVQALGAAPRREAPP